MGDLRGAVNEIQRYRDGIREAIEGFITDPPDSDFQAGYLSALIEVARAQLGMLKDDPLLVAGEKALEAYRL